MMKAIPHLHWRQVMILAAAMVSISLSTGCDISKPTPPSGPPAAWQTQLAVAQQAAQGQDANAILMQVDAGPVPGIQHTASGDYGILHTQFRFARSQPNAAGVSEQIEVTMEDTGPSPSTNLEPGSTYNWPPLDPAQRQQILQNIANVHISAADAYTRTIAAGRAHAARYNGLVYPQISLHLSNERAQVVGAPAGTPAVWLILYPPIDSQEQVIKGATTLRMLLDPQTGAVLKSEETP